MRKLPSRKLLGAVIAAALLLPETAFTLGLGEIEVNSALNQKLNAEIELTSAEPEETENIIVKLASRKEFTRAGLDRPYLLNDLRFKSETKDGVPHISISSGSPIREPFLNFLVEVDWPNGHMIREYTVLLDPPVFMTQEASASTNNTVGTTEDAGFRPSAANTAPVVAPALTASPRPAAGNVAPGNVQSQTAQPQTAPTNPAFMPAPVVLQQQTNINQPANSYRIQSGDTAWSLAKAMMPDQSISVEQMMIAMLRANPESFINENVNGLKRGYILRVPDYNQIVSINVEDARALVREQAALWRQYQQTQSGGQPTSAMSTDEMSATGESDDGAIITGEEDEAYLEIVSAGSGSSTMSGKDPTDMSAEELRAELALARERVETERVEKEALQDKVNSLEQNVGKMKGMLSIEDDELSDVQALGSSAEDADALDTAIAESEEMDIDPAADMSADEVAVEEINAELAADAEGEDAAAEEGDMEEGEDTAVFLDESDKEAVELGEIEAGAEYSGQSEEVVTEEVVEDIEPAQTEIEPRAPAGPLDQLLNDPVLLAAAGGGLLFIVALIGLIINKRRKAADEEGLSNLNTLNDDLDSFADDVAKTESSAAEQEEESSADQSADQSAEAKTADEDDFDLDATMNLENAEDTIVAEEGAVDGEDDEPRDDVIAEADVYLAYGIYQQAEELLTQAIADNPERDDYRVKLAETHYASKDANAFIEVATELKKRTEGEDTAIWKKVYGMGQDLCGDNSLFQGSMVGGLDVDALSGKAPAMDFDLGIDEAESNDGSGSGLSEDDNPLELPEMDLGEIAEDEAVTDTADELEFDISDAGAVEETAVEEDEFSLDIDASELDIDIQEETENVASAEDEVHELDTGDGVDLDFGLDDTSAEVSDDEEEISLDLTEDAAAMDLDLGADDSTSSAADDLGDDDDFDLSSLDDVDEISTKLDLARAYLDMGDNEGTREILDEVLKEGTEEQKQEANDLMAKLD